MILTKLQDIEKKLNKSIRSRSIVKSPVYVNNLVEDIKESQELVGKDHNQKEEIIRKLWSIYQSLTIEHAIIEEDCWDSLKHSLANNEPLSDKYNKYNIEVAYKNLNIVVEALKLLDNGNDGRRDKLNQAMSLQKKMKEVREKMQQQQLPQSATNQGNDVNKYPDDANENEYSKLEEEAKTKFSKCIENGTIDGVSIGRYENGNLHAIITLQDNNNTSIKISEFLNSKFCTENNIAGFSILNSSQEEVIKGYRNDKRVRYYDLLGTTVQYGIQFNWYVGEEKRSITLSANSDGNIKIVGDKPADEDLEKNKDVRIKVGDHYLSLASAVKTCKQNSQQRNENSASSKLNQPSADQVLPQERIASRK
ncbi:hypothetical protein [Wolbachia endosymbiont (group A) of Cheilosia soror]|uniref:hypothetical protein n=2 Tax=Wolbachieae TaxID=952 RepID=UPI0021F8CDBC|nr:hypothetical protein [Wolbachia endosymbiont (group A) of Cheilosia soror]